MNADYLKSLILTLTDQSSEDFVGFPDSTLEAANNWAGIFEKYMNGDISKGDMFIPGSDTISLGIDALRGNLALIVDGNGEAMFISGLVAMATAIAPGISTHSSGAFTGVPPFGSPLLSPIFTQGSQNLLTVEEIAEKLANTIDSWMKTGTYINNESGATLFWQ